MPRHHTIITGTGRAGTTFLVQLLTSLGLDTGFADITSAVDANCNAGMEWDIRQSDAPYIIKSPWLCDYLDELIEEGRVAIDQAIIPVRDLYEAAESRRRVTRKTKDDVQPSAIPGGLWHTDEPEQQEAVLVHQLYKIIYAITKHDIPLTFLYFPRLVHEPKYLYQKLNFLFGGIAYQQFLERFTEIVRPELVHEFNRELHLVRIS